MSMLGLAVWFVCGTVVVFIVLITVTSWVRGYIRGFKQSWNKYYPIFKACGEQAEHEMKMAGVDTCTKDGCKACLKRSYELMILEYKRRKRDQ